MTGARVPDASDGVYVGLVGTAPEPDAGGEYRGAPQEPSRQLEPDRQPVLAARATSRAAKVWRDFWNITSSFVLDPAPEPSVAREPASG